MALAFFPLLSCQSTNQSSRYPASTKPRHVIISIHGIAGTDNTFGSLLPALREHIQEVDQGYEIITANFVYATGTDNATVAIFKQEFAKFMRELFVQKPLTPEDHISIVAHSQGGLITTFWYTESLEKAGSIDAQIALRVKNIVTESTPFWGSKAAYLAYDKITIPAVRKFLQKYIKMSPGELKEMSFGSDSIYKLFLAHIDSVFNGNFEESPSVRMLNLSGVFPQWDTDFMQRLKQEHFPDMKQKNFELISREIIKIFNMGTRWESDTVVNNAAARIGFLYALDLGNYKTGQVTPAAQFSQSRFQGKDIPYHLVETVHASPEPIRMMDIAFVPERCLEKDQCDHPSYKLIFKHIVNCERENSTCDMAAYQKSIDTLFHGDTSYGMNEHNLLMAQMQTFAISINLRLPAGYKVTKPMLNNDDTDEYVDPTYARAQNRIWNIIDPLQRDGLLAPLNDDPQQIYSVYLGRRTEAYSRVVKHFADQNHLRFQFTGKVRPVETSKQYSVDSYKKMSDKGFIVRVKVGLPGLRSRIIEVPVKPTYMSFVDVDLSY